MTNEQREAIEYLERQIRVCNENAEICDDNNFDEEATHLREENYMLDTVLSLIKEQEEEIEKKDKIIDKISQNPFNELRVDGIRFCGKDIKQYFERKVEDVKD